MVKWAMVIDISRCTACYSCVVACKDEYWENDYLPYSVGQPRLGHFWIDLKKKERGQYPHVRVAYMPILCMHCDDPPCMRAAKNNAIYKRPDGIVIIDPVRAKGQKHLASIEACPYGVIFWNEEKELPQKCAFCVHRLEEDKIPRCVQACPSDALIFGDVTDPRSEVYKLLRTRRVEIFHPEWNTKINVHYIDLHKINKCLLAGSVVFKETDECAENVKVTLTDKKRSEAKTASTNNFGEFEFDDLELRDYYLNFEYPGYITKSMKIDLKTDKYLGFIFLEKT